MSTIPRGASGRGAAPPSGGRATIAAQPSPDPAEGDRPPDQAASQEDQRRGLTQRRGPAVDEREKVDIASPKVTREALERTRTDTPPTGPRGQPPAHEGGARPTGSGQGAGGAGDE
jgi:hypothetical protein